MTALNRVIFGGFRQLGITEEADQRAIYARVAGKPALSAMSDPEKQAVADELRRLGYRSAEQAQPATRRKLTGKYVGKLQALWIAGYNLGIIVDRDDSAMLTFIKGQAKVDDTRFLNEQSFGRKAVEGLKIWLARDGSVDWSTMRLAPDWLKSPGCRVARAQWAKLNPAGKADFWAVVTDLIDQDPTYRELKDREWITVMNYFGERIRKEKAGA